VEENLTSGEKPRMQEERESGLYNIRVLRS